MGGISATTSARYSLLSRHSALDCGQTNDVLRIAPTGRPWSAWACFDEHTEEFGGWYVNLEDPHARDEHGVYTSDHVLDLEIEPDHAIARKDEDELALAVEQGRFDATTAAVIRAEAAKVEAIVRDCCPPFCDGWEQFRPDPAWPIPDLPHPMSDCYCR